ncbi:DEAD/DEAH box helicase [Aureimonas pseudogalii]|uniref:DEAD-box ATP-dependent RNA helicase RhpA n=1 Tax=Aureimonas pseudogalii TaxID=1744844 RepID=A0A7W6H8B8_9HYPH|nr:DEAD/DEAH box helicase [Aureimonas pseudogalii]MBB4000367.1 superfamily II DNA/RNA helicase [Aureimonas pseudogalii]
MHFSELGLSAKVLAAVEAAGYTEPTPIQAQAIPHALQRKDVLGIAQTGTGKTASFVLPMLTMLETGRARARMPRTLIIEPTRELAAQVEESFVKYGTNQRLNVALLIGGVSFEEQNRKLERGVDVLIATPGRLLDHFERGRLLMTGVEILVIDEADRMLDMGFIPDIERICKMIPFTRQTLFFSATMPPEITRLADQFLQNPVRVEVAKASSTALTVEQRLVATRKEDYEKRETLRRVIRDQGDELTNSIIFCNRKRDVSLLFRSLEKHGFSVGALHGDMDQRARTMTLQAFRDNKLTLLVASDVAARGLDIPMVSHVFNFDVPIHAEDYVHRIGRTGRAGRSGKSFTLVTKSEKKYLDAIESLIGKSIDWLDGDVASLPAGEDRPEEGGERREPSRRSPSARRGTSERAPSERRSRRRSSQAVEDAVAAEATVEPVAIETAADETVETPVMVPVVAERPRRSEAQRPSERTPPPIVRSRSANERRGGGRDDASPVGFGDDVPAFMLISTSA